MGNLLDVDVVGKTHDHGAQDGFQGLCHQDLVALGEDGDVDAGHVADLFGPAAGRIDQKRGPDPAGRGHDGLDAAVFDFHSGQFRMLEDFHSQPFGGQGVGLGGMEGVQVAVPLAEGGRHKLVRIDMGDNVPGLLRRQVAGVDAQAVLQLHILFKLGGLLLIGGHDQVARLFKLDIPFVFQDLIGLFKEFDGEAGQLAVASGPPLHADTGSAAAGRAVAQSVLLQDHDIPDAPAGQFPGDGGPGDPAACNDDRSRFWKGHLICPP